MSGRTWWDTAASWGQQSSPSCVRVGLSLEEADAHGSGDQREGPMPHDQALRAVWAESRSAGGRTWS